MNSLSVSNYKPADLYIDRNAGSLTDRFDRLIELLLIGLLAFMPLAFGAVQAWSQQIVLAVCSLIIILFILRHLVDPQLKVVRTFAYIPVLLFVSIALLQLLPLPSGLIKLISPNTFTLRTELLSGIPAGEQTLRWMPLSLYSPATSQALQVVIAVVAIFFVVLNVFRSPRQIKRLLQAVAMIGGFIAFLSLAHNILGNGKIYWFISTANSKGYSGPFINHSNYGQFMNLSIGAAFALILIELYETFHYREVTPAVAVEYFCSNSARRFWILVASISLCIASVFTSLTRGGMISMLAAFGFISILLSRRRQIKGHNWVIALVALITLSCVLYIGFDAVCLKLGSLRNISTAQGGRVQILKDIAVMARKFPLFGTGLGTHQFVYPMFDRSMIALPAVHAENEYAQVLEETGLLGLTALGLFAVVIGVNFKKATRNYSHSVCLAAYGMAFGIVAILIHSLADFGQHLPANAMLTAIFAALLIRLAAMKKSSVESQPVNKRFHKFAALLVLVSAVVICAWSCKSANDNRIARYYWNEVLKAEKELAANKWQGTAAEYNGLILYASSAVDNQPSNVFYRYRLNTYKWRKLCRTADLKNLPKVRDIVAEFHNICHLCPTFAPAYYTAGWIETYILEDEKGHADINKGYRLAPCDSVACYNAARLDLSQGRIDQAADKFKRAVKLKGSLFDEIADLYINELSKPELVIELAGEDIGKLNELAVKFEQMLYLDLVQQTHSKLITLLHEKCAKPNAPAWAYRFLAHIYKKQMQTERAIDFYGKALSIQYDQVYWRLELANLLVENELMNEAMAQAKICLQLEPGLKDAKSIIADCSVHPSVIAGNISQ